MVFNNNAKQKTQNENTKTYKVRLERAMQFLSQNRGRVGRVKSTLLKLLVAVSFFLVCYLFISLLQHQNSSLNPNVLREDLRSAQLLRELKSWSGIFSACNRTSLGNRSCEVLKEVKSFTFPVASLAQSFFSETNGRVNTALTTYKLTADDFRFLEKVPEVSVVFPRSVQNNVKVSVGSEKIKLSGSGIDVLASFSSARLIEAGEISLEFDYEGFPWFGPAELPVSLVQIDAAATYTSLPLRQLSTANLARQIDIGFPLMLAAVAMVLDHSYVFANLSIYAAARAVRSYIPFLTDNGAEWDATLKIITGVSSGVSFSFLLFFVLAITNTFSVRLRWKFALATISSLVFTLPFFFFDGFQVTYDLWSDGISSTLAAALCVYGIAHIFMPKGESNKESTEPLLLSNALLLLRLALVLTGTFVHAYANWSELFGHAQDSFKSALDWKHSALLPFIITAALLEVGSTARKIVQFGKEMATKALFEKELSVGKEVQQRMLPKRRNTGNIAEWRSLYFPAQALAGDWYDVREIALKSGKNLVVACVADVTGHGVGSSLSTSVICSHWNLWVQSFHSECDSAIHTNADKENSLVRAASQVHNGLLALPKSEQCTAIMVIVDPNEKSVTCCTCGHPGALICDDKSLRYVSTPGDRLGAPDIQGIPWTAKSVSLLSGETLYLYSDGIVPPGETITSFAGALKRGLKKAETSLAFTLWKQIQLNRRVFRQNVEIEDDMTLLAIRLHLDSNAGNADPSNELLYKLA